MSGYTILKSVDMQKILKDYQVKKQIVSTIFPTNAYI